MQLERVVFEDCDLSNSDWELPSWKEVELRRCRVTGLRLRRGRAAELKLEGCQGRYLQFEETELKGARFEGCEMAESTWLNCRLDGAVFTGCDLRGTVLSGVRLNGADLRGCRIDGLRASLDDLAGAILDPRQAAAVLFGQASIRVLEEGEPLAAEDAGGGAERADRR